MGELSSGSLARSDGAERTVTNLDAEFTHRVERDAERILPVLDVPMLGDDLKRIHESAGGDDPLGEKIAVDSDRGEHGPSEGERGGSKPEAGSGKSR